MLDKAFGGVVNTDQYYFQIKLGTLRRLAETQPITFRVSIQKGLQKVDSTKDLFTLEEAQVNLNEQPLNFYLPSFNANRPIEFTIMLVDERQQEFTNFKINSGQFITEFIKTGKNVFTLSDRFNDENHELEYSLYIEKSRATLFNLTKRPSVAPTQEVKSPEKEEPPAQPTRSQIARSPVVTRTLTPKKPVTTPTKAEEVEVEPAPEEPPQEPPKPALRSSGTKQSSEVRSPLIRNSQKQPPKVVEPEPEKEQEVVVEPVPEPPKRQPVRRTDPPRRTPVKQQEPTPSKTPVKIVEEVVRIQPVVEAKPEIRRTDSKKIDIPKEQTRENKTQETEPASKQKPKHESKKEDKQEAKDEKQPEAGLGNKKYILLAVLAAVVVFGLMFLGGSKTAKKRVVGKRRK